MISESLKKEIKYWITRALAYKSSIKNAENRPWYPNKYDNINYYDFRYREALQLAKNTYTRQRI
jgi:hypothetical protein